MPFFLQSNHVLRGGQVEDAAQPVRGGVGTSGACVRYPWQYLLLYILPWESILRNAASVTSNELFKAWPHPPDVGAHMIRFIFHGADEQHCMAWLKELHVRSHVLVGLGRIYAEHLHELVSTTPAAKELLDRAATFAVPDQRAAALPRGAVWGCRRRAIRRHQRRSVGSVEGAQGEGVQRTR